MSFQDDPYDNCKAAFSSMKNSSLPERNLSTNSVDGSGETQDREEPLSVEACKANLHFYATKKELAFHAHKQAIIEYEESLTALNNALTQKYLKGGN
jgi:hypothetical protein